MSIHEGPTSLPCTQQCEVPAGVRVAAVPQPRHNWSDVVTCPNDNCGWSLLVLADGQQAPEAEEQP